MYDDIRWKQRLSNYSKAVDNIKKLRTYDIKSFSDLEKEGVIQRFEVTLELAWKTLKDKMEDDGIILDKISPKSIIKQAFQAKYIDNIESWIEMIEDRNVMSHTYNEEKFEEVVHKIIFDYIKNFEELIIKLN